MDLVPVGTVIFILVLLLLDNSASFSFITYSALSIAFRSIIQLLKYVSSLFAILIPELQPPMMRVKHTWFLV